MKLKSLVVVLFFTVGFLGMWIYASFLIANAATVSPTFPSTSAPFPTFPTSPSNYPPSPSGFTPSGSSYLRISSGGIWNLGTFFADGIQTPGGVFLDYEAPQYSFPINFRINRLSSGLPSSTYLQSYFEFASGTQIYRFGRSTTTLPCSWLATSTLNPLSRCFVQGYVQPPSVTSLQSQGIPLPNNNTVGSFHAFFNMGSGISTSYYPAGFQVPIYLSYLPDLTISSIYVLPGTITSSTNATAYAVVKNIGKGASVTRSFPARIEIPQINASTTVTIYSLNPGASQLISMPFRTGGIGNFRITASADGGNRIIESNENNNSSTIAINVLSQAEDEDPKNLANILESLRSLYEELLAASPR